MENPNAYSIQRTRRVETKLQTFNKLRGIEVGCLVEQLDRFPHEGCVKMELLCLGTLDIFYTSFIHPRRIRRGRKRKMHRIYSAKNKSRLLRRDHRVSTSRLIKRDERAEEIET